MTAQKLARSGSPKHLVINHRLDIHILAFVISNRTFRVLANKARAGLSLDGNCLSSHTCQMFLVAPSRVSFGLSRTQAYLLRMCLRMAFGRSSTPNPFSTVSDTT